MGRWLSCLAGALTALLLLSSQAFAGPPFRTDDPETVDFQHYEITTATLGTEASGEWSGTLPELEVNYGVVPNLQLHAIVLQNYIAPPGGRTSFALGDIELGAKYRFLTPDDNDWFPQAAVFPTIEVPAGDQKLGFNTGHAQIFLPLWLQKDFDPWTVYGGGGYWINPGVGNKNWSFFGVALWRKITEKFNVGVEVFHQTSPGNGVKESTGYNVGTTYDFSSNWHLLSSVGSGIQNQPETNRLSYYLALQLTF